MNTYIFVDESGDPGKPYRINDKKEKETTGASLYYILTALPVNSSQLFLIEDRIIEIKNQFKYKKEIKSTEVSLNLYKILLTIINEFRIKVFYRCINKTTYKGAFEVRGQRHLHNVFDDYNVAKVVSFAIKKNDFIKTEAVIDRSDRRLLDGKFDNFNEYLMRKVNTKTIKRINYVTHVNSEYVHIMQLTDLISGAIKNSFTKENSDLKKVINKNFLIKVW